MVARAIVYNRDCVRGSALQDTPVNGWIWRCYNFDVSQWGRSDCIPAGMAYLGGADMTDKQQAKRIADGLATMKALSIRQPWCHRILHEGKNVENRDWPTKGRGWVIIHAAKSEQEDRELIRRMELPLGGVVGLMKITDCVTEMYSEWFYGKYGFVIGDVIPLPFIPCKGQLGFFNVGDDVKNEIRQALSGEKQ